MADDLERLRRDYAPLLLRHLTREDETGLGSAYELGREAMRRSISLLDVVRIHNETYLGVLATVRDVAEAREVARAASAVLLELIASYEMAQRGFMDLGLQRDADPDEPADPDDGQRSGTNR